MKQKKWKDISKEIEEIRETTEMVKNSNHSASEKNKMLEDFGKIMNKLRNQGIAIFTDEVFYGKAPTNLLRDPAIKLQAKGLYSVMHSYANPKELMLSPKTFVSIATLAKDVGLERKRIIHWIKHLEEEGWILVKRRGFNLSNWYVLHSKKKYKKN